MSFISCIFFKSYFYFIAYWILDFLDLLERDYFESKYSSFDNDNNNNNNTNYTNLVSTLNNNKNGSFQNGIEINVLYLGLLSIADMSAGFLVAYTFIRMNHFKGKKEEMVFLE